MFCSLIRVSRIAFPRAHLFVDGCMFKKLDKLKRGKVSRPNSQVDLTNVDEVALHEAGFSFGNIDKPAARIWDTFGVSVSTLPKQEARHPQTPFFLSSIKSDEALEECCRQGSDIVEYVGGRGKHLAC